MTENKRFRVIIGNENDVKFMDCVDNRQLISISFKDYEDAVDCRDALLYQCNLFNELNDSFNQLKSDYEYLEKEYKELARDYSEEEEAKIMWHSLYEESQKKCKKLKKSLGEITID